MLDLTRMRYLLRKGLGLATGAGAPGENAEEDMTNEDADELLNLALWDIEAKFPFREKETLVTTDTVVGQQAYTLPNDLDAIVSVSYANSDNTINGKLERLSLRGFEALEKVDVTTEGRPSRYVRRGNALLLVPVPDAEYTLRLVMWKSVASLLEGTVDSPDLPRNWHELVVEGAISRGHFYNRDYRAAQEVGNMQIGKMRSAAATQAKEEQDSGLARVRVVTEEDLETDPLDIATRYYLKDFYGPRIP